MTDPKTYAGVYAGKTWAGNVISVYQADGTCFTVLCSNGMYIVSNTGRHSADGGKLTVHIKPLIGSDRENVLEYTLVIGQKITHSDKYGAYDLFLKKSEVPSCFNVPPKGAEVPPEWMPELKTYISVTPAPNVPDEAEKRRKQEEREAAARKAEEERKKAEEERLAESAPSDGKGGKLGEYYVYVMALTKEVYTETLDESGFKIKGEVYALFGIDNRGKPQALPAFSEERNGEAAWTRIFGTLKPLVNGVVHFIIDNSWYDDSVIKPPLETAFPDVKYYKNTYSLPFDAPYKPVFSEVSAKFKDGFNAFWRENTGIADLDALKKLTDGLQAYLEKKLS